MFDRKEYYKQYYKDNREKILERTKKGNKNNSIWLICPDCGEGRWVRLVKGEPRSFRCRNCAIKGKNNPMWNGGIIKNDHGYILIWQGERKYKKRSRLIMEEYLSRELTPKEVIHHINGIKIDDRIENLELFKNHSEHMTLRHGGGE